MRRVGTSARCYRYRLWPADNCRCRCKDSPASHRRELPPDTLRSLHRSGPENYKPSRETCVLLQSDKFRLTVCKALLRLHSFPQAGLGKPPGKAAWLHTSQLAKCHLHRCCLYQYSFIVLAVSASSTKYQDAGYVAFERLNYTQPVKAKLKVQGTRPRL